jgi:predicted transposase/invertase (TIGR01784 family)
LLFIGNLSKFEKEIKTKIGRSDTMGTQKYLLDKAEKKGIQKGIEKGKREEAIAIALEFKKMCLPHTDIAKGTGLSIEEIEKL